MTDWNHKEIPRQLLLDGVSHRDPKFHRDEIRQTEPIHTPKCLQSHNQCPTESS